MAEAGDHLGAAVDAGKHLVRGITAQGQRLFDDRSEVLVLPDMDDIGEGHHLRVKTRSA